MYSIEKISEISGEWNNFVFENEGVSLFHLAEWSDICEKSLGEKNLSFGILNSDGKIVCAMPVSLKAYPFFNILHSSGFGTDGGPIYSKRLASEEKIQIRKLLTNSLSMLAKQTKATSFTIKYPFNSRLDSKEVLAGFGIADKVFMQQIGLIELNKDLDSLLLQIRNSYRQAIKKAEKSGFAFEKCNDPESVSDFYVLKKENIRRSGAKPIPQDYYDSLLINMGRGGKDFVSFFFAKLDNDIKAAAIVGKLKDMAYYISGCSKKDRFESSANCFLQWNIIKWARENNCIYYIMGDLMEDTLKNRNISFFKKGFGTANRTRATQRIVYRPVKHAIYQLMKKTIRTFLPNR